MLVEDDDARIAPAVTALASAVERGRIRKLGVERVNGAPVIGCVWEELLLELGFRAGPRKLTIGA
jgi:ATP-dependent Lhr-like helicase